MARSRMLGGISTTLLALAITSLAMVRMCVRAYIEASVWVPCGERRNASMHSVLVRGVARSNIRTLTRAHASELLTRALTCTDKHICTSTHAHSTSRQIHILNSAVCRFRSYPPIPLTPSSLLQPASVGSWLQTSAKAQLGPGGAGITRAHTHPHTHAHAHVNARLSILGGRGSGGRTLAGDEEGEEDGDEEEDEDCCPEDEVHVHVVWVRWKCVQWLSGFA